VKLRAFRAIRGKKKFILIQPKNLHVGGIALFPFIFIKSSLDSERKKVLINHERIHLRQQLEMLLIPFYIIYIFNYLINLIKYKKHSVAYRNIIFEIEAFKHERDLNYLNNRKAWNEFNVKI